MFSKSCKYGLRSVIFIAGQAGENKKVSLTAVASGIDSPQAFTAKILQQLTKSSIVNSTKGPYGGFFIRKEDLETILLSDVVSVFDGDSVYTGCGLGLSKCDAKSPCPLHDKFITIRANIKVMLNSSLAAILNSEAEENLMFLKR